MPAPAIRRTTLKPAPPAAPVRDVTAIAKRVIAEMSAGAARVDTTFIRTALVEQHRIDVTHAWIKDRLLAAGWRYAGRCGAGYQLRSAAR